MLRAPGALPGVSVMLLGELQRLLRRLPFGRVSTPRSAPPVAPSDDDTVMPRTEAEIVQAAETLGLIVPDACMPGVVANLALLDTHAVILLGRPRRVGP